MRWNILIENKVDEKPIIDPITGDINLRYRIQPMSNEYFMASRSAGPK